jgi:hypothetical protein
MISHFGECRTLDLSSLQAPLLQHLRSDLPVMGLFAPQLTHIELCDIKYHSTSELLDILERFPLLESFRLTQPHLQHLRQRPPFTETPHRMVILPNLRFLQLKLNYHQCSYLIGHISRLDISTSTEPLPQPFESLMAAGIPANLISTRLRTAWIHISSVCVNTDFYDCIQCNLVLKGWSESLDVDLAHERSLPQIHLDVGWFWSKYGHFGTFLVPFCRLVGQQDDFNIIHVDLRGSDPCEGLADNDIPRRVWYDALGGAPVDTLRVNCGGGEQLSYIRGLLHAVQGNGNTSLAGSAGFSLLNPFENGRTGIFPTLQKVILDGVDFTGSMDFGEDVYAQLEHRKFVEVLPNILSGNATIPAAMDLRVQHCLNVTEEQISQLKGMVGNVSWDGEEIEYDSSNSEYCCSTSSDCSSSDSEALSEMECVGQSDRFSAQMLMDPAVTEGMELFDSDGSSCASSESESDN